MIFLIISVVWLIVVSHCVGVLISMGVYDFYPKFYPKFLKEPKLNKDDEKIFVKRIKFILLFIFSFVLNGIFGLIIIPFIIIYSFVCKPIIWLLFGK